MSEEIEYIIEESLSPDRYCLVHNYIASLQQKVEELENIRKEAIDFVKKHARIDDEYPAYIEMLLEEKQDLLNILNKGDKNVKG